ncbi:MAG: hypothetical protein LBH40_02735 [Alphaproteobacteria bacterium]|jgi:hypothetical protein|nr:hypothetical protein [Alphaproteobacteria bacterium]
MNNFFNKKEDYIEDDFDSNGEDFLNPSMKDMNDRNQQPKAKKNKNKAEGAQFIGLTSLDDNRLFKKPNRNVESSEAIAMIIRGFVFIFMFLISLFGIFLIFKTPYYNMYSQKEPIILDENKNLGAANPFSNKSPEDLRSQIINEDEESTKVPTGVVSQNKPVVDEDEMLRREFENSKATTNKQDTDLTKLLKDNVEADTPQQENNVSQNESVKQMSEENVSQSTISPVIQDVAPAKPNVASSQNPSSAVSQRGNTTQSATPATAEQTTWLVTIYSTPRRDEMPERLLRLKDRYKNALNGVTFYFVENQTNNGGMNYRISVAKTLQGIANPSFNSNKEAKSFCDSLKSQGLDCFVSTVNKSSLPGALIR